MKKAVLLIALLLIVIPLASADKLFVAEIEPDQMIIREDKTAEYNLTITHTAETAQTFEIYSPNIMWDIRTKDPLRIKPKHLFKTKLYIQPLNVMPGIYGAPIHVRMVGTNLVEEKELNIEITSLYPPDMTYLPAVKGRATIQKEIDPRKEIVIRVNLENQNRRDLEKVDIKIRSNVINKDYSTSLSPFEEKELKFTANIDDLTPPKEDALRVTVLAHHKDKAYQFDLMPQKFYIKSYSQLDEKIEEKEKFLRTQYSIILENKGNTKIIEEYKRPTSWFKNIFVTATPKPEKIEKQLVWPVEIKPGEKYKIQYTFNFIPLFIIICAAILLIISYYVFRSPLVLGKAAAVVGTKEGGISELKIMIDIVNRSKKPIKKIKVIDQVPRIAEVIKEHDADTLKPDNVVKHERKGTIIKWSIDQIEPGEERVLTYKIKSKLSILGGVRLPATLIKFSTITGRHRTANSNAPIIGFIG